VFLGAKKVTLSCVAAGALHLGGYINAFHYPNVKVVGVDQLSAEESEVTVEVDGQKFKAAIYNCGPGQNAFFRRV